MLITFDITSNPPEEGGGFLYSVYIDNGETLTLIGSGQHDSLPDLFNKIQSLTERTML